MRSQLCKLCSIKTTLTRPTPNTKKSYLLPRLPTRWHSTKSRIYKKSPRSWYKLRSTIKSFPKKKTPSSTMTRSINWSRAISIFRSSMSKNSTKSTQCSFSWDWIILWWKMTEIGWGRNLRWLLVAVPPHLTAPPASPKTRAISRRPQVLQIKKMQNNLIEADPRE